MKDSANPYKSPVNVGEISREESVVIPGMHVLVSLLVIIELAISLAVYSGVQVGGYEIGPGSGAIIFAAAFACGLLVTLYTGAKYPFKKRVLAFSWWLVLNYLALLSLFLFSDVLQGFYEGLAGDVIAIGAAVVFAVSAVIIVLSLIPYWLGQFLGLLVRRLYDF
ncbi:MAG: hypothetical protein K6L76_13625 [Agarilytica sp.]